MACDIITVQSTLKSRADNVVSLDSSHRFWQDEDNSLPNAEAFAFFEITTDLGSFIEFGGGIGANRARVNGEMHAYVFSPRPTNLATMLSLAEEIAVVYRNFRPGTTVFCNEATVIPIGEGTSLVPSSIVSAVSDYKCVLVVVNFYFDQQDTLFGIIVPSPGFSIADNSGYLALFEDI